MGVALDLTGKKFGKLTAVHKIKLIYRVGWLWRCDCDCGNTHEVTAGKLRSGQIRSCGCGNADAQFKRRLPLGEYAFKRVFSVYQTNAQKRGIGFHLSEEEFRKLTQKACSYCGEAPSRERKDKVGVGSFVYNGIDRVDSSFDYTVSNSVPCCWDCNRGKGTLTVAEYLKKCTKVVEHQRNKLCLTVN